MADIPSTEVPRFTQFHSKAATMEVATEVATAIIIIIADNVQR